jgi:hypothetical protein
MTAPTPSTPATASPRDDYLHSVALQACVYAWPLYEMQRMRAATSARKAPALGFAGDGPESTLRWSNLFTRERALLTAGRSRVVMPNNDTLYINAWVDLSAGPVVIRLPETGSRYYVLGMLDYYTNPFAHVGTRTTGNGEGCVLLSGPGWEGDVPAACRGPGRHIRCATPWVWIIGRILVDGPADVPAVNALQDGFDMLALQDWQAGRPGQPRRFDSRFDARTPWSPAHFATVVNDALRTNPPPAADATLVAQFAQVGIGAGAPPLDSLPAAVREAFQRASHSAHQLLQRPEGEIFGTTTTDTPKAGWRDPIRLGESFGSQLLLRAFVARQAIGALETREAAYPRCETDADGALLHGGARYRIRFAPGQLPPVNAFWSITLYSASDYFLVPNPIDRFAIGDRTPGLVPDADGGLTLFLQHAAPDTEAARANWLPAPADGFFLCLRAYLPRAGLLDGSYRLPAPERIG